MDFLNKKSWDRTQNGRTQHDSPLRKSLQFNFKATTIGIVRQKNLNSFLRFDEYLLVSRNSVVRLRFRGCLLLYVEDQAKQLCCLQLIRSKRCKAVGEVWPEIKGQDYRSRSDRYSASPMLSDKEHGNQARLRNPSVYSTGDWRHTAFLFWVAAFLFLSDWSVKCRVWTSQSTPARACGAKSLCKNI